MHTSFSRITFITLKVKKTKNNLEIFDDKKTEEFNRFSDCTGFWFIHAMVLTCLHIYIIKFHRLRKFYLVVKKVT